MGEQLAEIRSTTPPEMPRFRVTDLHAIVEQLGEVSGSAADNSNHRQEALLDVTGEFGLNSLLDRMICDLK